MLSINISQRKIFLHDISTQITDKSIWKLIKKYSLKNNSDFHRGIPYFKNGKELQRIYITLNQLESVNRLMEDRSKLRLNGYPVRVKRSLPNSFRLHDRDVTGIKVTINNYKCTGKVNENDLKRYFNNFGQFLYWKWINTCQTEALFAFADYDLVDHIILSNPSPKIKGIKFNLEKTPTIEDYPIYERPYIIHITNLPLRVTSEEISMHFKVPVSVILLYPCFRIEHSCVVNGRSSSEAWIKDFSDEETARDLAEEKNGTFIRTNKIQCKAMLEKIDRQDPELCKNFQEGQCPYTMSTCHFKHFSCSEPDTCNNQQCWYGHTQQRTTFSVDRSEYYSDNGRYRVRLSNLPSNITEDKLMAWMKINKTFSKNLKLQPVEQSLDSSRMAYLERQPVENRLRQQIDTWHNTLFSSDSQQKIRCQLEINQEHYEWNDLVDTIERSTISRHSSISSIDSAYSSRATQTSSYSSIVSIRSSRQNSASEILSMPRLSIRKTEQTINSVPYIQESPIKSNYFPSLQNTTITISSLCIPSKDPFIYIVSLIYYLKEQLTMNYSQCVRWLTEQKNHWFTQHQRIEHDDVLIFSYQTKSLPIHIHWNINLLEDNTFSIDIKGKVNENKRIELPIVIYKIGRQTYDFHFNNFQMQIKILVDSLCQSIAF